jgi:hypothetical protein
MTELYIIGLHAAAGAGKSTTAKQIAKYSDGETLVLATSFAGPLYESVSALLGLTVDQVRDIKVNGEVVAYLHGDVRQEEVLATLDGRTLLERYGTEAHRDVFGQTFWLDVWEKRVFKLHDHYEDQVERIIVTVDDARFKNELAKIRSIGGFVVGINGSNDFGLDQTGHPSRQQHPVDYTMDIRHGDEEQNRIAVRDMLRDLIGDVVLG